MTTAEQIPVLLLAQTTQTGGVDVDWWYFLIWGMLGGLIVDGLEIVKLVKQDVTRWAKFRSTGYLAAEFLRILIGGILAVALGLAGEVEAPLGALIVGVTAPIIVDRYLSSPPIPAVPGQGRHDG